MGGACICDSTSLIFFLEKLRSKCTFLSFQLWCMATLWGLHGWTWRSLSSHLPGEPQVTLFQAEVCQKDVKKLSWTKPAALGKQSTGGGRKWRSRRLQFFSLLRQKTCLVSVNTILKCIEAWRKPICYGLQWDEIAISAAESVFSYTKVSIDSGEKCQFSHARFFTETHTHHFAGRWVWPLLSHLLGRQKGNWFLPHKQATAAAIACRRF